METTGEIFQSNIWASSSKDLQNVICRVEIFDNKIHNITTDFGAKAKEQVQSVTVITRTSLLNISFLFDSPIHLEEESIVSSVYAVVQVSCEIVIMGVIGVVVSKLLLTSPLAPWMLIACRLIFVCNWMTFPSVCTQGG